MKTILAYLLALTAVNTYALPNKIQSHVCGHEYVEGVKKQRAMGGHMWICLNKKRLPKPAYEADVSSKCAKDYVEGETVELSFDFDYKLCLYEKTLEETYIASGAKPCANGYSSDEVYFFKDYDERYPLKICVRDLK